MGNNSFLVIIIIIIIIIRLNFNQVQLFVSNKWIEYNFKTWS